MAAMLPMVSYADAIVTTYLTAKQEIPTSVQLTNGTTASVSGTEKFTSVALSAAGSGAPFTSSFGTGGVITGAFTGSFGILAADQYGGAGGAGRYLSTFTAAGVSIKFAHTAAVPGVNYFGLDISALDAGNQLDIYRSGVLLQTFSSATLTKALGACPNAANPYCGNPTTAANAGEPYAFLSIFDLSGYFDEIKLSQPGGGGGFESDNFTAGYRQANVVFGTPVSVAEPASALVLAMGLVGLMMVRRRGQDGAHRGFAAIA